MEESKPENNTHTEGQEEHGAVGGVVTENSGTTGAASGAQMDTSGQPSGEPDNLDAMFTHLNMTNEQIQAFKNGMQDFSQSFSGNSEDERQDAIREEQKRQLQAILSPKQLEAYSEWKENK
jgi:Spy/CpxP family protein refolding chaperone